MYGYVWTTWLIRISFIVSVFSSDSDRSFGTIFNVNEISEQRDDICYESKQTGPCRARFVRYYYHQSSKKCVKFVYGGCRGNGNRFKTQAECRSACVRHGEEKTSRKHVSQACSLEVDMLDQCKPSSDIRNMALCGSVPLRTSKSNCLSNNCCWHPTFHICHSSVAQRFSNNQCKILYSDSKGFIGITSFQSNGDYSLGWVGYLQFTSKVTGNFCLLKNPLIANTIKNNGKKKEGELMVLSSTIPIYGGQNKAIVFAGSYGSATITEGICEDDSTAS